MASTLDRHQNVEVIVPHCGGALPVLADRINGFMKVFMPAGTEAPTPSSCSAASTTTSPAPPCPA
ncbi:hypothetical protein ACFW6E_42445 [Streptomyces olivaceoviridis]|uniref:hypothetical protein n=1 Tax=Streptomyces olivaceoviridis TaxID=1921 RepID=UPI00369E82E9